jgi:hypothetical protein
MGVEHLQRIVIANGTQAAVEAETAALAEVVFGRDTATGAIGYSVDGGANWVWLPSGAASALNDLTDVTITSATSGDLLTYNGSAWVNSAAAAVGQYRQFLYVLDGAGDFQFLTDDDGHPLMALLDLE